MKSYYRTLNLRFSLFILMGLLISLRGYTQETTFNTNTLTKVSETYPCISKDGEILVFSSDRDGDLDIYITYLNEDITRKLINLPGDESHPDISSDGQHITFYATIGDVANNHREIYLANIDGTNIKRMTNNQVSSFHPKFTPDGESILYNKQVGLDIDKYEFYTLDIESGDQELLLADKNNITMGSISPDGSKLVFVKWLENMNTEIFLANSDGTEQINISDNLLFDGWPTWSSSGNSIIFSSDRDEKFHFHLFDYNLTSKVTRKLTEGERQFIQAASSSETVFANSSYSRDSSAQIVSFALQAK